MALLEGVVLWRRDRGIVNRERDLEFLRLSIEVAERAKAKGNHPFGAVLVHESGEILATGENSFLTDRGPGHAETNLARLAAREFDSDKLAASTLYTSVEPCSMCSGTIYWANIGAVVFGMTERRLLDLTSGHAENQTQDLPCRTIFASGQRKVEVRGPFVELEAALVAQHSSFWATR